MSRVAGLEMGGKIGLIAYSEPQKGKNKCWLEAWSQSKTHVCETCLYQWGKLARFTRSLEPQQLKRKPKQ